MRTGKFSAFEKNN